MPKNKYSAGKYIWVYLYGYLYGYINDIYGRSKAQDWQ